MPVTCLPDTGLDGTQFAIIVLIAATLITVGIVALRRSKGATAFILAPLVILALVLGTGSAPVQASNVAYPSATLSDSWNTDEAGTYFSDAPVDPDLANLITLSTDKNVTESVVVSFNGTPVAVTPPWAIDATTYVISFSQSDIEAALADEGYFQGEEVTVTFTFTYDFTDECDKPLQTVYTYTGVVAADVPA